MAAPLAQPPPLYSLRTDAFDAAVSSLLSRALPGFELGSREDPSRGSSSVPLKKLPDALANPGLPGSCPRCGLAPLEGCMVDICLACGERSYAAGIVSQMRWSGSVAQHLFLQSIPFKAPKNKRRSSQQSSTFTVSPSNSFLETPPTHRSPAALPLDPTASGGGALGLQRPAGGSSMAEAEAFGSYKSGAGAEAGSGSSPWSASSFDGAPLSMEDPMSVFSLTETVAQGFMGGMSAAGAPAASRDASALDDFFAQLGGTAGPSKAAQPQNPAPPQRNVDPAVQSILDKMPDLSFLLADRLVVPDRDPGNFPPKVPVLSSSVGNGTGPAVPPASAPAPTPGNDTAAALAAAAAPPTGTVVAASYSATVDTAAEDGDDDEWGDFES